ncbi:MAG: hypothetical protein RMX96_32415 [Nostoc sp. ChiSLP02]|nr:hypothetical protein [Nostoc sp. DedSLP05]MDZ8101597.1 hypothetical protein [Nostoc sp. DedSLP01]MDZ8189529.1 hypothetical protein [Nostoc sp. ChiSLP02]
MNSAEALEKVKAIAQAGKNPEDSKNNPQVIESAIPDLPSTVKLVEVCGQLLPMITKFFGLP